MRLSRTDRIRVRSEARTRITSRRRNPRRGQRPLVLACFTLAACGGDDAPPPVGEIGATVTHYDYRFDVESRAAHAAVTLTVDTEGDCVTLPFRGQELDAAGALVDGKPAVRVTLDAEALTVCGAGHRAGEQLTLEVDLVIPLQTVQTSQVGYSRSMDSAGNPFYYLVSWVGGCDRFGPCDNRPDQFATYTFHVTHPEALMVACSGVIANVSPTETECAFDHPGGPTYSTFGVAAYPKAAWVATDKGMWGSVRATVYDRPTTNITAAIDPTHHAGFVTWMEQTFGPYPFGSELRVLTAPTYWNGFEHPGSIMLDDGLARATRPSYLHNTQHILDHEIAHQWAGDETTLASTYDFVWKEAMAEYLTFVYEDMVEPQAANVTAGAWRNFANGANYFPVPDDKPELFTYYGDVYGAGPMVLFRQIEVLSSRAQVIAALQTLLGEPRAISVDDVLAALETSTGLDLDAYAAAWIHGTGAPEWPGVLATFTPGAETSTVRVQVVNGTERRCKFHVQLNGANADEYARVEVDTFRNGIDQTFTIPTPAFTVTSTLIDPFSECLVYASALRREKRLTHPWVASDE
ncbi:MAG TPA: M1 family aminopeptidase [Kofleriaceae bacterium]|nr:M1 family aminopeptidase [Kofleriaceae bacterium]